VRVAAGVQDRLSERFQPLRPERAEDVAVGPVGGAKACAELDQSSGCGTDPAATPIVGVDPPRDKAPCLKLVERLNKVGSVNKSGPKKIPPSQVGGHCWGWLALRCWVTGGAVMELPGRQ
jgi:hypothetical protein